MRKFPKLESIVKPIIINLGYEFLGIEYISTNKIIRIFINSKKFKIKANHCEEVYTNLVYILNAENYILKNKYEIEISSRGINSLLLVEDLVKNVRNIIKVHLTYPINKNNVLFGKLLLIDKKKKKIYLQNKKKIFLLYFYQIDKVLMI